MYVRLVAKLTWQKIADDVDQLERMIQAFPDYPYESEAFHWADFRISTFEVSSRRAMF